MEDRISEEILKEWLTVSAAVQNTRIVRGMTFNEALVCNHLWYQRNEDPDWLTPTELCRRTGMQKSLMNRTLKKLAEKEIIEYVELKDNKRSTPLRLRADKENDFLAVHNESIKVVDALVEYWGPETAEKVRDALKEIGEGFQVIHKNSGRG